MLFSQYACNSGSKQANSSKNDSTISVGEQNNANDYSGVYKTSADNLCLMTLTITREGENYNYRIIHGSNVYLGKLIIETNNGETYFTFDGQIDENKPKTVSGQLVDGSITIQNYGNSMNEYHYFKKCDEKYLAFKK